MLVSGADERRLQPLMSLTQGEHTGTCAAHEERVDRSSDECDPAAQLVVEHRSRVDRRTHGLPPPPRTRGGYQLGL